ncbi:MAG: alpha/beta fold hydrolase, partial [Nitrososphaerales archaeon]
MTESMPDPLTAHIAGSDDDVTRQIVRIWKELLSLDSVGFDQNYFDLGGDSSVAVQMFTQIEKIFKVKLPLATLYEAPTIEELARILRGDSSSSGWSPLVTIQPEGYRPPIFCFHGAGGNVLNYRDLSKHLGSDQPFYGLQSQGLDGSCPPLTKIEDMAGLYIKEIRKVQPHGPYFLAGYCGGGTIAFEAAQQLQSSGEAIALLALFDTMDWSQIHLTAWNMSFYRLQKLVFHAAEFLNLNWKGKSQFLREKMAVLRNRIPVWRGMLRAKFGNGESGGAKPESMVLAEIWKMNDRACESYVPQPYPGVITDFRPAKQYRIFDKPNLKWDRLAQKQQIIVLPVYPASMLIE